MSVILGLAHLADRISEPGSLQGGLGRRAPLGAAGGATPTQGELGQGEQGAREEVGGGR